MIQFLVPRIENLYKCNMYCVDTKGLFCTKTTYVSQYVGVHTITNLKVSEKVQIHF